MKNFFKPTKVTWWTLCLFVFVFIVFLPYVAEYVFSIGGVDWYDTLTRLRSFVLFPGFVIFNFTFYQILGYLYGLNEIPKHIAVVSALQIAVLVAYAYFLSSIISILWYKFRPKPKLPEAS